MTKREKLVRAANHVGEGLHGLAREMAKEVGEIFPPVKTGELPSLSLKDSPPRILAANNLGYACILAHNLLTAYLDAYGEDGFLASAGDE